MIPKYIKSKQQAICKRKAIRSYQHYKIKYHQKTRNKKISKTSQKTKQQQHWMRDEEKKNRRKRENEQLCGRREVLFIGNGGAYRRLENAHMHFNIK